MSKTRNRALFDATIAEFFGTMVLAFAVGYFVSVGSFALQGFESFFAPFAIGLTLFFLVATLGYASGAHFNPAVTLALAVFRKVDPIKIPLYLGAQFVGAWVGIAIARFAVPGGLAEPSTLTSTGGLVTEFIGALLLGFAVASVVLGRVKEGWGAPVIGVALTLGVTIALGYGGGLLNPALAGGLEVWSWRYWVMPLLGVLCGTAVCVIFDEESTTPKSG